jgi:hypothetical protein
MKMKLITGAILLSVLVWSCEQSDLPSVKPLSTDNQTKELASFKSSSAKSEFEKELNKTLRKFQKKLEKRIIDEKNSKGEITAMAALPEIPLEELMLIATDDDVLEFVDDMVPAAYHFLVQEFQIDCSGYSSANIVNAAVAGNYYLQTVDSLIGYETDTVNMTFYYFRPESVDPDSPLIYVIDNCLRAAMRQAGYDLGKATFTAVGISVVSKQTIKEILLSALAVQVAGAVAAVVIAWITWDTIWCVSSHYLTPVE